MANLIVRNVDEGIIKALKTRAVRHGTNAEAEHRKILAQAPGNSEAQLELARVLSWAKQYSQALREFDALIDRKSTRLNSSHIQKSRMPSSA